MKESDKELLELAAKAAGYKIIFTEPVEECVRIDGYRDDDWNPLEDDGDSARLAVACKIDVNHQKPLGVVEAFWSKTSGCKRIKYGSDENAATRLAILLAAAEIGRAMP